MTAGRRRSRGVGVVAVALVVAGLLVNGYLAAVARAVTTAEYAAFGAFWSLALLVGFGVFLPVEQVLARELPAATDRPAVVRSVLRPVTVLLGAELLVVAALSPLLWVATGRDPVVLAAIAALCVVSAGQFVARGWLVGLGAMGRYAVVLVVDSALRVGLAVLVGRTAHPGIGAFAWALVAAIAVAHVPVLLGVLRVARTSDGRAPDAPRAVPLGALVAGSLAGQVLLNGVPIAVAALAAAGEQAAVGRFQAAFVLARVPLFLATPLQALLVPPFAAAVAADGPGAVRRVVRGSGFALAVLAVLGAAIGLLAGPTLVRVVFGAAYTVGRVDVALLAVGSACYLVTVVLSQLLVVQGRRHGVAAAWGTGVLVATVVLLAGDPLTTAAVWSFVTGSATAVVVALVLAGSALGSRMRR